jgi:GYF domain 2
LIYGINVLGQEEHRRKNARVFRFIITLNIMYKIIGADQKEYGPISAEQMRQWITEGRINAQTQAQAVGETTWKPVSMFPEFAASFSAAPPPLSPMGVHMAGADVRLRALQDVTGPAIGLMITAGLGILYALLQIILKILGNNTENMRAVYRLYGQNPNVVRGMQFANGPVGIIMQGVGILICLFILYGALKMKKLENYGLSVAATILAMIPCFSPCLSPCCLIGLPIGIWALVVLNKPEVKSSFS